MQWSRGGLPVSPVRHGRACPPRSNLRQSVRSAVEDPAAVRLSVCARPSAMPSSNRVARFHHEYGCAGRGLLPAPLPHYGVRFAAFRGVWPLLSPRFPLAGLRPVPHRPRAAHRASAHRSGAPRLARSRQTWTCSAVRLWPDAAGCWHARPYLPASGRRAANWFLRRAASARHPCAARAARQYRRLLPASSAARQVWRRLRRQCGLGSPARGYAPRSRRRRTAARHPWRARPGHWRDRQNPRRAGFAARFRFRHRPRRLARQCPPPRPPAATLRQIGGEASSRCPRRSHLPYRRRAWIWGCFPPLPSGWPPADWISRNHWGQPHRSAPARSEAPPVRRSS